MKKFLLILVPAVAFWTTLRGQQLHDSLPSPAADSNIVSYSRDTITLDGIPAKLPFDLTPPPPVTDGDHTPGVLSVSLSGAATYTVPINVPPGIAGVAPAVTLTYNSQAGNGLAGWGWNISGISAISRIPANHFYDGMASAVDFSATDRFALDGQRLLLKSGTYGRDGAVYETEQYSNLKITSHGTSPYGANYGPAYFKVTYPDGAIAYYGNSSNSITRMDYALSLWHNAQGIPIRYTYQHDGEGLLISTIEYGYRQASSPVNDITFSYKTRIRPEQAYFGGFSFNRTKLLEQVNVHGSGMVYRIYVLSHDGTLSGYERLRSIQEKSGNSSLAPITFNYTNTPNQVAVTELSGTLPVSNIEQRNSAAVTGDFTGNGKMDFIIYPTIGPDARKKFWLFTNLQDKGSGFFFGVTHNTGDFKELFAANYLSGTSSISNRMPSRQGLIMIQGVRGGEVDFTIYGEVSAATGSVLGPHYKRVWQAPRGPFGPSPLQYVSGDFNTDGLTDIIAIEKGSGDGNGDVYFINLDKRLSGDPATKSGRLTASYSNTDRLLSADVTGDGKSEIIHIREGRLEVYDIDKDRRLRLLWDSQNNYISGQRPVLPGDYNGDGKTDLIFPQSADSKNFTVLMSDGASFRSYQISYPFEYKRSVESGGVLSGYNLIAVDVNGDGRTDIIDHRTTTYSTGREGFQTLNIYINANSGSTTGYAYFASPRYTYRRGNLQHFPIPLFLSSDRPNANLDLAVISNEWVTSFQFLQDEREDMLLRSVVNNGITQAISYKNLNSQATGTEIPVYKQQWKNSYPYVDIESARGLSVVTKLQRSGPGIVTSKQLFGYQGAVTHMEGLGFCGFRGITRSNWHTATQDRLFDISLYDPAFRGAVVRTFTTQNTQIRDQVAGTDPPPTDLSLSTLSSGNRTVKAGRSVTLLPGFSADAAGGTFVAEVQDAAGGISDGATQADYISRTDYQYHTQLRPNKVFVNMPVAIYSKDLLDGTNVSGFFNYDSYQHPVEITTQYGTAGSRIEKITYANNIGTPYYIGRPQKRNTTFYAGGDTYSTEEEYSYTGYLLTGIKSKGHNTAFITESRGYDGFGNIIQKTITPSAGAARTTRYTYDPGGRFLTKQVDADGLATTWEYNTTTGDITRETNPYGLSTRYEYNAWGEQTKVIDYLGRSMTTTYQKSSSQRTITRTGEDGSGDLAIYDGLGRLVKARQKDMMGNWAERTFVYDHLGRRTRESEPYTAGSPSQWNQTTFDIYGRIKQTVSYTGKTTNITYNGLSVSVNDGIKTVTTTKDALGNVVKVTDPGGTITYTYFASGTPRSASYEGNVVRFEQDGWGRRTKLTDPSAGTYTYAYNDFGELTRQTTPKGVTIHTYDAAGKLVTQKIQGDHTDMQLQYGYDATSKLPISITLTDAGGNNSTYTYSYDQYKRPSAAVENNAQARFARSWTYDGFGRVYTQGLEAKNHATGKTAAKKVRYTYQNGVPKSILDDGSAEVIWALNAINARGQAISTGLGSAVKQTNAYDGYGLASERKTEKTAGTKVSTLMKLNYSFNPQRGLLNSRSASLFGWNETFGYDHLDRLTSFKDNGGQQSQAYDKRGRIISNSALGTYKYNGSSYRQMALDVNTIALPHYKARPLQQVSYNAFKSPVEIIEEGHDRISFEYNAFLGRSHSYFGGTQADKLQRRYRKHYAADGSMEIIHDVQGSKTSFVFYLGGDAYSAPAIWREDHSAAGVVKNLYYLHRDYLGSILLITDRTGAVKEKRHFDAWGATVKWQDGQGHHLNASAILDRGFTGHEHLLSVGLIHMNGRLYDPALHRFLMPDNYMQDPFNTQYFNRYGYVLNNPLAYVDEDGELPILIPIIGAVVGGGINLWVKASQGKIHSFTDGLAAFGIGAVAGAAAAFAGPAALTATGLSAASISGGIVAGTAAAAVSSPLQGVGNALHFGDPYSIEDFGRDVAVGGLTGGIVGGASAFIKSGGRFDLKEIWSGDKGFAPSVSKKFTDYVYGATKKTGFEFGPAIGYMPDQLTPDGLVVKGSFIKMDLSSKTTTMQFGGVNVGSVAKTGTTIFQKHHIIPNEAYKVFKTDLKAMGWKQNDMWNLKKLPVPFHGNHPAYNKFIMGEMRALQNAGNLNLNSMQNLQHQMRLMIGDAYRSGGTLNQHFKF